MRAVTFERATGLASDGRDDCSSDRAGEDSALGSTPNWPGWFPGSATNAVRENAQADWTNRADEPHNAATVAGIQIGYDRAIAAILKAANKGPIQWPTASHQSPTRFAL